MANLNWEQIGAVRGVIPWAGSRGRPEPESKDKAWDGLSQSRRPKKRNHQAEYTDKRVTGRTV